MHSGAGADADAELPQKPRSYLQQRSAVDPRHHVLGGVGIAVAEDSCHCAVRQGGVEAEHPIRDTAENLHASVSAWQQYRRGAGADERKIGWRREALLGDRERELSHANPEPAGELRLDERVQQRNPAFGEVDEHLGADFSIENGIEPEASEANDEGVAIRRGDVGEKGAIVGLKQPMEDQVEASILRREAKALGPRESKRRQVIALVRVRPGSRGCLSVYGSGLRLS